MPIKLTGRLLMENIDKNEGDWLALRQSTIGSSEIAILFGESPWQTVQDLYEQKRTGNSTIVENAAMWWGKKLESSILERFAFETKLLVKQPMAVYCDANHDFCTASPDSWVYNPDTQEYGIGEIKNISAFKRGDWETEPPEYYRMQVLWQLGVTGLPWAFLIAKMDNDLIYHKIFADSAWYEEAVSRAGEFIAAVKAGEPYQLLLPGKVEKEETVVTYSDENGTFEKFAEFKERKAALDKESREIDKELKLIKDALVSIADGRSKIATEDGKWSVNVSEVKRGAYVVQPSSYYNVTIKNLIKGKRKSDR